MADFTPLLKYAEANNLVLPADAEKMLEIYIKLLLEWNDKINLTAITSPEEIVVKHFIDSLSVMQVVNIKGGQKLIDVGTGAGFPGMVLKILCPDLNVTLLDGHAKRFLFLEDLEKNIGLFTEKLHIRAELAGKDPIFREQFDFATARAVASLNTLAEYCLPFVKVGGSFIAMKGPDAAEEADQAKKAISILGAKEEKTKNLILPNGEIRNIIVIKKKEQTNEKYPRASAKISKKPL